MQGSTFEVRTKCCNRAKITSTRLIVASGVRVSLGSPRLRNYPVFGAAKHPNDGPQEPVRPGCEVWLYPETPIPLS